MSGLLRICTAGSVDDGKSTLIGRLLYDSRAVYEDQLHSVEKASKNRSAGPIDFSLFTDGLRAEREQGITIDVAYRYFATARRKFILADTPGHEQYTRNMATGASTADVAILLVDARHGVRAQSRRHAQIARLLGITRLCARRQQDGSGGLRSRRVRRHRRGVRPILPNANLHPIPISALHGDNVITRSERTPWFDGHVAARVPRDGRGRPRRCLEAVPHAGAAGVAADPRIPRLCRADRLRRRSAPATPSRCGRRAARRGLSAIVTWDGDLEEARAGMSVTLTLEDEIDISRGDMIAVGRDRGRPAVPGRCRVDGRAAARSRRASIC